MRLLLCLLILSLGNLATAMEWQPYPSDLIQFDYSGDKLKANWDKLTMGTQQEWPDEVFIKSMATAYPKLENNMLELAAKPNAHPAVKALLNDDFSPLAAALQQAWRLHYEGKFEQAYNLGMQLGAAGSVPAIYSKLIHTTFLVHSPTDKLAIFQALADKAEQSLELTPGYEFGEFGLLYAHARTLELLDTSAALSTGLLGSTQKKLKELSERYPDNSLFPASYAGIQAGVVERVGSFVGRVTYGATASRAVEGFQQALELQPNLPVIYNEFIVALKRINHKKHNILIQDLAAYCLTLTPYSAEEALNQALCKSAYTQQDLVKN